MKRLVRAAPLLAALAALVVYGGSVRGGRFLYDDQHLIVDNGSLADPANLVRLFHDPRTFDANVENAMFRPVLLVTLLVDRFFFGLDPSGYHLANVLLHALIVLLVHLVVREAGRFLEGAPARGLAAVVALVFAVHPAHGEAVLYVSARSDLLSAFFVLLALFAWMRFRRAGWGGWVALSGVAFLLGLLSKEVTAVLPAAVLLLEGLRFVAGRREGFARAGIAMGTLLAVLVLFLGWRGGVLAQVPRTEATTGIAAERDLLTGGRPVSANLWTQARVFWEYAGLYVWPARLSAARGGIVETSVAAPRVLLALAGLALWAGVALALARRRPMVAFGLLWFPLALAPTSSFVPLNVIAAEHRLYLPGVGLLLAGAAILAPVIRSTGACAAAGTVVAAALGVRAAELEHSFRNEVTLWGGAAAHDPTSFRARLLLGNAHAARQEWSAAAGSYREALRLYPRMLTGWINLGEALRRVGLERRDGAAFDEGEEALRRALALEPRSLLTHLKLARLRLDAGRAFGERSRLEAAARGLEELPPRSRQGRYVRLHLASIRRALGDDAAAEALFTGLVKEAGHDPSGAFEAATLLEDLGEPAASARLCEAILGWVPFHRGARERLGRLLLAVPGREQEGAAHLRMAGAGALPSVR